MDPVREQQIVGLLLWLEKATNGLTASARARIKLEIEAHLYDAIDAGIARGESPEAATTAALAELGDPKIASRRFRAKHLTIREEKHLSNLLALCRHNRTIVLAAHVAGILLLVAMALCLPAFFPRAPRILMIAAAILFGVSFLNLLLAKPADHPAVLLQSAIAGLAGGLVGQTIPLAANPVQFWINLCIYLPCFAIFAFQLIRTLRLWQKVRHRDDSLLPPPRTSP